MSTQKSPQMLVAVIGVGLVGSEFINQLLSIPVESSPFRLISLTSSSRTIFREPTRAITSVEKWKSVLSESTQKPDYESLTKQLSDLITSSTKVSIVDNTSSDEIAALYPVWLKAGINVITPNKKAYSGDLGLYEKILNASKESGARFLNESTVGAGLPKLVATGDKVKKIEGVFSGTMSYIFNEFSTGSPDGPSFSSVVSIAREKGYHAGTTSDHYRQEPHPADDLNGFDVARKLTILSRTIGSSSLPSLQSFASVQTASLIPAALEGIPTGDEFLKRLPDAEGKGEVKAGLEKYPVSHPFATSLGGSDNIIMPLIVQGAGAGAAVTAMGVLRRLA
ncbi:aspartate kinase homoserine dehydrogenase [Gymnopus androsaceus JB14]|uniref:homoserine dehydrogenase n=1 Tax=Gymnopus androsaceus JB14 TaxID=1447944 RepID=A0A6A4IBP9_9AGAR|nr:aspartate kinase homoserine dehydrogenase [Gymnopus androsaceus JB14]